MRNRNTSRSVLLAAILLVAVTARANDVAKSNPSDDARALREIKEVLWPKAYREQDVALLDRILADEFRSIDAEGNWSSKAEELEYIRAHKPSHTSFKFEITRLDVFENGSAIVAGTGTVRGTDDKGAYVVRYQSTNVLIRRSGQWRAIASHVSGMKRTPGLE